VIAESRESHVAARKIVESRGEDEVFRGSRESASLCVVEREVVAQDLAWVTVSLLSEKAQKPCPR
jgi:hypothetical protein